MSAAAPQLTYEQAYDNLFARVHAPAFFNKLASHGIKPKNEAEAREMLTTAGKLRTLWDAEQAEKAAASTNTLTKLSSKLDGLLASKGLSNAPATEVPNVTPEIQKVASSAALDGDLAAAVLTMLAHQNQAA